MVSVNDDCQGRELKQTNCEIMKQVPSSVVFLLTLTWCYRILQPRFFIMLYWPALVRVRDCRGLDHDGVWYISCHFLLAFTLVRSICLQSWAILNHRKCKRSTCHSKWLITGISVRGLISLAIEERMRGLSVLELQSGSHLHCHSAMEKTTNFIASFFWSQVPLQVLLLHDWLNLKDKGLCNMWIFWHLKAILCKSLVVNILIHRRENLWNWQAVLIMKFFWKTPIVMVRWHYGGRICTSCRNAKVRNDKIEQFSNDCRK